MTEPTVLTLEPLDFNAIGNTLKLQLRGIPCHGREVVKVNYPASFQSNSIDLGVQALDDMLHTITGPKLVFAHSQGAQVVSRWLRESRSLVPQVEFLLIGNPLRKYGGYIIGRPEVGGRTGLPTPTDSPYPVTDLKMQYDGWADWPSKPAVFPRLNAMNGQNKRHCYGYLTADPADPKARVHVEGRTRFVMLPAPPTLPIPQAWCEAGYDRPEK